MRLESQLDRRDLLRLAGTTGLAGIFLSVTSCTRRKDGVIVQVSDQLQQAGVEVRDWRRNGANSISVQLFSPTPIPGNAWAVAIYDKDDNLLWASNRMNGPEMRARDIIWLRFDGPFVDLMNRADRVIVSIQLRSKEVVS
jgi:hypothetical protein